MPTYVVAGVLCVLLFGAADAGAATIEVTTTQDPPAASCPSATACSVRAALAAGLTGDTVVLPAGRYELTQGQLVLNQPVTIRGAGAALTIIDASALAPATDSRVLDTFALAPVTIADLTVTGGRVQGPVGTMYGVGGGGIRNQGPGPIVLDHAVVEGNSVTADTGGNLGGGGIWSAGSVELRSSVVRSNTVDVSGSNGDSGGGGIMIASGSGNLAATDATISDNTANVTMKSLPSVGNDGGGGVYQDGHDIVLTETTVAGNTVTVIDPQPDPAHGANGGGGIYQFGNLTDISSSTISGNAAHVPDTDRSGGGGLFDDGEATYITNSTFTANMTDAVQGTGTNGGGGIYVDTVHSGVRLAAVTIAGNASASEGGGIAVFTNPSSTPRTVLSIAGSIVAANQSTTPGSSNCANLDSILESRGANLADDPGNSCAFVAAGDLMPAPALLGPLAANGGPTSTMLPASGSPAIDAGDPAGCRSAQGGPLGLDQRAIARPQGARCDIGAVEVAAATTPTEELPATVPGVLPAPGAQPAPLVTSTGIRRVCPRLPRLTRHTLAYARRLLKAATCNAPVRSSRQRLTRTHRRHSGRVVRQDPRPGRALFTGQSVVLLVD